MLSTLNRFNMVNYNGINFENNPNRMNKAVQWEGRISLNYGEPVMSVYGFNEQELVFGSPSVQRD